MEEISRKKEKKKLNIGICGVCGDSSTCYRLYGANSICFSCRNFFRRSVKGQRNNAMKCIRNSLSQCTFNKFTRNECKSCRYNKCLKVGMNPLLVDSCKNITIELKDEDENLTEASTSTKSPDIKVHKSTKIEVINYFTDEKDMKNDFLQSYENVYNEILLDPEGLYITKQLALEEDIFTQMSEKRTKIKLQSDYWKNLKIIVLQIAQKYLSFYINGIKAKTISRICQKSSQTLFSLFAALETCYTSKNILEQFYNSYHFPQKVIQFFKEKFPYLEDLKPYKPDDFEIMTSPFTPNHEDEVFLGKTFTCLRGLIRGDTEVGRLLAMLVMFSSDGADLTQEESMMMKQYQSKITIILYNHILSDRNTDNMMAVARVSSLISIIPDISKCGDILFNDLISANASNDVEDSIDSINISTF